MKRGTLPPLFPIGGIILVLLVVFLSIRTPSDAGDVRPAPPLVATTLDGQPFDLSQQSGKLVLVNFWATWCGPCRMEFPDLNAMQKKYGPKGFTVVGVAQETDEAAVRAMVKEDGLNYPVVMITREIAEAYKEVESLPTSFLVDQKGRIVFEFSGVDPGDPPLQKFGREIEKRL